MITFDNISLRHKGKDVFKDLYLKINRGEKVVVLGRSGCGKSSLFSLLLGFVRPDKGSVWFDSAAIDEKSVWTVRKKIAFVDQDTSLGIGKVSAWLDFIFTLKANATVDLSRERVLILFGEFELERDTLDKDIIQLSGGQRQRLAIIAAILLGREVFLLDEVTSALDGHLKKKVADFFIEFKERTVIAISHDSVWLDSNTVKVFDLEAQRWRS